MIKYWQSTQDYKYFLTNSKVHFDSSERRRLHSELWKPWQKLRLFDTDIAMAFLLPFFSSTGRPARNQPQILRSFLLFLLLLSEGLAKPSLTLWVKRLKRDRVLAALIGCSTDSLPPLGSYFDFMDRLWNAPLTDRYGRNKLLPASWNSKKPDKPKGKHQKAQEAKPKITEVIENRLLAGRDIPFNFEERLQRFFYLVAVLPSLQCGIIPAGHLTVSGDGTSVHTHACPFGHHRHGAPDNLRHFPDPDASWGWTVTWISITSATLCSSCPAITAGSTRTSLSSCVLPARGGMIPSAFWSLSMNWKNICRLFPLKTSAWTPQWTIIPPTAFLGAGEYGPLST